MRFAQNTISRHECHRAHNKEFQDTTVAGSSFLASAHAIAVSGIWEGHDSTESSRQSPKVPRDKSWKGDKSCLQMHCCTWRNLEVISQGDLRLDGHEAFCRPLHGPNDVAMLELARGERHQGSQGRRPLELKVSGVIMA